MFDIKSDELFTEVSFADVNTKLQPNVWAAGGCGIGCIGK